MKKKKEASFRDLVATSLFCPRCKQAMPVRERLLLVLPDGDLYEYRCARCHTPVGKKKDQVERPPLLIAP